ncbi:hypothetical protein [Heyndrickxia acidiproducens]|nr:hypothetical protein [Heyndrickxia acidiproducens]
MGAAVHGGMKVILEKISVWDSVHRGDESYFGENIGLEWRS